MPDIDQVHRRKEGSRDGGRRSVIRRGPSRNGCRLVRLVAGRGCRQARGRRRDRPDDGRGRRAPQTYGSNTFAEAKKASKWQLFMRQYADPMQIVLLVAGIVCLFLPGQFYTGVFLLLLTLFNAWMAMNQEGKAEASASALQSMMVVKAKVRRDGDLAEIPMDQLVPGDIVNIEAGDLVPADARILSAATLEIDESALTGESVPTPKQVDAVAADAALGDRIDMAFMNCQVTRGAGTVLVTTTGMATEVGHISGMLQATGIEKTPLTKQLDALTNQILVIAGISLVVSIGLGLYRGVQAPGALPECRRVRGRGHPDGAAGGRHRDPVEGLADARRRRRDHEAPALGRDARVDIRAQLRQDRHPHAEPDDGGPDGDRRPALRDQRRRLPDDRADHPHRRPAGRAARAVPPADGPVRRRRGPRRRARRRSDRGRAGRPCRQGRRGPDAHPRAVPAGRDAAVRCGLQDDGHLPRDEGRERQGRHPRLRQGRARPAPCAGRRAPTDPTGRRCRSRSSATPTSPRTSVSGRWACGSWRPARRTSTRRRSTRTPICCRPSTG